MGNNFGITQKGMKRYHIPLSIDQAVQCSTNTYGMEEPMKQAMEIRPRNTLAMSLESCAHSLSPFQTHSEPLGQIVEKLPPSSMAQPNDPRARTSAPCMFWWERSIVPMYTTFEQLSMCWQMTGEIVSLIGSRRYRKKGTLQTLQETD